MNSIKTINPSTEEVIKSYPLLDQLEVQKYIENTAKCQQAWAEQSLDYRLQKMQNLALTLRKNAKQYTTLIANEMGKPISQGQAEIEKCAMLCDYYRSEE